MKDAGLFANQQVEVPLSFCHARTNQPRTLPFAERIYCRPATDQEWKVQACIIGYQEEVFLCRTGHFVKLTGSSRPDGESIGF
jgi:hypothetical protein